LPAQLFGYDKMSTEPSDNCIIMPSQQEKSRASNSLKVDFLFYILNRALSLIYALSIEISLKVISRITIKCNKIIQNFKTQLFCFHAFTFLSS